MAVIHRTPTVLDTTALTVFGAHSKPNSASPIGYFGTGLKYAMAVLVRHGIDVHMVIDGVDFKITQKKKEFRDTELPMLRMDKRKGINWRSIDLPFTTTLGKNWELWQAFRELHSNTLDEGGRTYEESYAFESGRGYKETIIWVDDPRYTEIYKARDTIFLPEVHNERQPIDSTVKLQIFDRPSTSLYYRGMRVYDFGKNHEGKQIRSSRTYNLCDYVELTEDRTIKHPWLVKVKLAELVIGLHDLSEQNAMSIVADSQKDDMFEAQMDWEYTSGTVSDVFKRALATIKHGSSRGIGHFRIGHLHARAFPPDLGPEEYFLLQHLDKAGKDQRLSTELQSECRLLAKAIRLELSTPTVVDVQPEVDSSQQPADASALNPAPQMIDDEVPF